MLTVSRLAQVSFGSALKEIGDYAFSGCTALTDVEDTKRQPCSNCYYKENCKPCLAVSSKLHNELYIGHEICELWKTQSR